MSKMIVTVTFVLALITGAATAHEVTLNPSDDAGIHTAFPDSMISILCSLPIQ